MRSQCEYQLNDQLVLLFEIKLISDFEIVTIANKTAANNAMLDPLPEPNSADT